MKQDKRFLKDIEANKVLLTDAGTLYTATEAESAFTENRLLININTVKTGITVSQSNAIISNTSGLNSHTGDTSIHFTKNSINLSDLGLSAHTHSQYLTGYTDTNTFITGATVTGTTTKTINLYQNNGNIVQASFTDETASSGSTGTTYTFKPYDNWQSQLFTQTNLVQGPFIGVAILTGTITTAIPSASLDGYNSNGVFIRSSTTANGGYRIGTASVVADYFGSVSHKFTCTYKPRTSFVNTTVRAGYLDTSTVTDSVDGAYFEIDGSGNVIGKTASNSVRSSGSTVALTINTAYKFEIGVNALGTSVAFKITNVITNAIIYNQTLTTNIPTTNARVFGAAFIATESSVTASDIGILYEMGIGTIEAYEKFTNSEGTIASLDNRYSLTGHTHIASQITDFQSAVSGNTAVTNNTAKTGITLSQSNAIISNTSGLNSHTGDTSIHFTKNSINLSDLGSSAHTHTVSEISNFPTNVSTFSNDSGYLTGYTDTNIYLTGATVTGTTTKSINLFQSDGSLVQASFTDVSGGGGSGESVTGSTFNTSTGDLTLTTNSGTTITTNLDDRYSLEPLTGATGSTINLGYSTGAYYNITTPLSGVSYTITNIRGGGFAVVFTNSPTEPTLSLGGTSTKIGGASWVANTDLYLNIYSYDGINVFYYWSNSNVVAEFLAEDIIITDLGSLFTATEVEGALAENRILINSISGHTGDTSIHFTKNSINLSDLGSTGHTHTVSNITDFPTNVSSFTNDVGYLTGATNTADFIAHTGDTNIHFTKNSINLSDLGSTGHTHNEYLTGYTDTNIYLTGATVTGTTTKSINLYQSDGSLVQASFTDISGSGGDSITGATFNTSTGDLTLTTNSGTTITTNLDDRYSLLPLTGVTGSTINLGYVNGAYYNIGAPLASTAYTAVTETIGGNAIVMSRSTTTKPTVVCTGTATEIPGSPWVINTDMYITIYSYDGINVFYYWSDNLTGVSVRAEDVSLADNNALFDATDVESGMTENRILINTKLANISEDSSPQLGGELDFNGHSVGGDAQGITGVTATTINWALGNYVHVQFNGANETFTFSAATKAGTFILKLVQDSTGGRTVTWPASVKWMDGSAPAITPTANTGTDIITFYYDGTNYFGTSALNFS